jgi:hypothetical protein
MLIYTANHITDALAASGEKMVSAYFQIPGQIKENQGHPGSV